MSTRYVTGKVLELSGMCIVAAALIAGMGLTDGQPSMAKEMTLLGIGGLVFYVGLLIEGKQP